MILGNGLNHDEAKPADFYDWIIRGKCLESRTSYFNSGLETVPDFMGISSILSCDP